MVSVVVCLPQSSLSFLFLRESLTEANAHQLLSTIWPAAPALELDLYATVPGFSHAFQGSDLRLSGSHASPLPTEPSPQPHELDAC